MNGTLVIWMVAVAVAALVGTVAQLLLWWHGDRSIIDALAQSPGMWAVYLVAGVLVAEHCRRLYAGRPNRATARDDAL